ncbi:MAG TPA: glycosyl transferase, partial [Rhodospirillales bacterium]|nr:glycosyl transferase [Rhodospirillales bacterium]
MTEEHPFAQYVRIIGKGPNLSRPLTEDEMLSATRM